MKTGIDSLCAIGDKESVIANSEPSKNTMNSFRFSSSFSERMRDQLVIALRKAGFYSWRDNDLHTDASFTSVSMTWGNPWWADFSGGSQWK